MLLAPNKREPVSDISGFLERPISNGGRNDSPEFYNSLCGSERVELHHTLKGDSLR